MVKLTVTLFIEDNPSRAYLLFKIPDNSSSDQEKEATGALDVLRSFCITKDAIILPPSDPQKFGYAFTVQPK